MRVGALQIGRGVDRPRELTLKNLCTTRALNGVPSQQLDLGRG
eukprot:CAMPEP_0204232290 /NCGR_PEP_ID=MMETSP0361-20130328/89322_1 /ASSEMBLY_ACC=CAM_ASM_000343 /TAXON_ID=268821 /ORGANISM="Scrippsiella Hangoei, Strain SHTV-5" /LENGTH=42 /DNA_ID= /DNA_START= /DNA_END= /DNA_ORIENTATION=